MRVAQRDASGAILNLYAGTHSTAWKCPSTTWAMHLADDAGRFRFFVFDFDAKDGAAKAADYDAGRLRLWLNELQIPHLLVHSGPTGGRHVWLALDPDEDGAAPELAETIVLLARELLPTLDPAPMRNPATGAVRPPGAPHRAGGRATPRGATNQLEHGQVTVQQLEHLRELLVDDLGAVVQDPIATTPLHGVNIDDSGHGYLRGHRRPLSARLRALAEDTPKGDFSRISAAILAGAAQSRWRYDDVVRELLHFPGLEHIRSSPHGHLRRVRRDREQTHILRSEWARAVTYVAHNPVAGVGDNGDFLDAAGLVGAAIARVQQQADLMPGLWGQDRTSAPARSAPARYSHRAVLDAVSLYMLQAVRLDVEADIRRIALDTGYGRTAVAMALRALCTPMNESNPESAWLVLAAPATGAQGARYRLSHRFSTEDEAQEWSQPLKPPSPHASVRTAWMVILSSRLSTLAHDVFSAPRSLGRSAGRLLAAAPVGDVASVQLAAERAGLSPTSARRGLRRLASSGLVERVAGGWTRPSSDLRDRAATALGVAGYLAARRTRYQSERAVWAWWIAESSWLGTLDRRSPGQAHPGTVTFMALPTPAFPRYPRGPDRRADHQRARRLVDAGALDELPRVERTAA